jgi:hypothetical protein
MLVLQLVLGAGLSPSQVPRGGRRVLACVRACGVVPDPDPEPYTLHPTRAFQQHLLDLALPLAPTSFLNS